MNQEQAAERARELNRQLGERGDPDRFYLEHEVSPGEWEVVEHRDRPSRWERVLGFLSRFV